MKYFHEYNNKNYLDLDIRLLHQLISHPPHILNEAGEISPSAFIPFCELGQNMTIMDHQIKDPFTMPVCNSFTPKIMYDQLCYEVDVNKYLEKSINKKDDMRLGLTLLIDTNKNRQLSKYKIINVKGDGFEDIGNILI